MSNKLIAIQVVFLTSCFIGNENLTSTPKNSPNGTSPSSSSYSSATAYSINNFSTMNSSSALSSLVLSSQESSSSSWKIVTNIPQTDKSAYTHQIFDSLISIFNSSYSYRTIIDSNKLNFDSKDIDIFNLCIKKDSLLLKPSTSSYYPPSEYYYFDKTFAGIHQWVYTNDQINTIDSCIIDSTTSVAHADYSGMYNINYLAIHRSNKTIVYNFLNAKFK